MCFSRARSASRVLCAVSTFVLIMTGCSSMYRVPLKSGMPALSVRQIRPGDTVRVTLRDGTRYEFEVRTFGPDAIVDTDGRTFPLKDVQMLEQRRLSNNKLALWWGVISAGTLLLMYAIGSS